jgi:uncharacterized protein YjbI with pentapeptide repeats
MVPQDDAPEQSGGDKADRRLGRHGVTDHSFYKPVLVPVANARQVGRNHSLGWALLCVAGAIVLVWMVLMLPTDLVEMRHMALTPKEQLDAEAGVRTSIVQLIGGAALLAGVYFTSRTFRLTREGHITDRYSKAIEQLGNENADVRVGGIYALERIARDSATDRETIVDVLATFVREHTRDGPRMPSLEGVGADVQAALSVLCRRTELGSESRSLDLYFSGLTDADLTDGRFRKAMFYYSVLNGALFFNADLNGAGLSFCKAKGASFNRAKARDADFVNAEYTNCWFIGADLTDADFYGCDLSGSDFGRRYAEAGDSPLAPPIVTNARFTNAKLARTNLRGVDLRTVRGLLPDQLAEAITDENTLRPSRWRNAEDEN